MSTLSRARLFTLTTPLLVSLLSPALLVAQTVTGTLQGKAADVGGGVLPGVTIAIVSTETGQERTLTTNERGFFSATFLPIGRYRVTASLSGFGSVLREKVEVTLNSTTVLDFTLDPKVSEQVRVTAEQPHIDTTDAEIKQSLSAKQIEAKPTLTPGSFLSLAEVFTGFQENPTSGQNNPTLSSGSSINFNGTGTRGATFQINGINNDDASENQNRQGAALSTIKEFQVITNNFSAEFGRGYGAVVLVQTKSGTNDLRGDAYVFYQNNSLNEKSYFARSQPKPENHRAEYGFTAGFPIVRDDLFGFVSLDRTERKGKTDYARDLFLSSELAATRLTRGNDNPANRAFIDSILARYPQGVTPNDPRSNRTYATQINFNQPDEDYSGRLDWNATASNQVTTRYQYTHQIREADDVIVGEQAPQNNKQQNVGLTWTHLFSPRTAGEFRYGLGLRSTNVDIAAGDDTPIIRFAASPVSGAIIGNAGAFPIHRDQTDHQFVYNLSTLLGNNHSIKAGADIRREKLDDRADNFSRGFWSFNRVCGGTTYSTAYAAFLDGCVASFTKAYGPFFLENRINEYNLYAEDDWQVTSNLTLNLGVRYEYVTAPEEVANRIQYTFRDDKYVEPRLGLAYVPSWQSGFLRWLTGGPGNASIRGGYGVYHGRIFQSIFSQGGASVRTNPPNAISLLIANSLNLADPTNGFIFTPGPQAARHPEALIDPNLKMPYTRQWNLTFERKTPFDSTLRVSYTGNHGVGLLRYTLGNLPVTPQQGGIVVVNSPNNAPAAGFPDLRGVKIDRYAADFQCAGTGLPGIPVNAACPKPVPIADNEISLRVPRTNERRPDPRFTTNLIVGNGASSDYHGLQVEILKSFGRDLQFQASYTFSKAIDNVSEATSVGAGDTNLNPADEKFARGLSRFDTRHRFTFFGAYALPIFRDRRDLLGTLLGGWQFSTVIKLASGTPFTVIDTGAGDAAIYGYTRRPVLVNPSVNGNTVDDAATSQQQLPGSGFRRATPNDPPETLVGRNTFFSDGVKTVDVGLYKAFPTFSGQEVVLRLEVYNLFNRTQFGIPVNDIAAANFGQIVVTSIGYSPRTVQLGLRYVF